MKRVCTIEECDNQVFALDLCTKHYRDQRNQNPAPVRRNKIEVGYSAAHKRVERERGSAALHRCLICNEPALQWSLGGDAEDVQTEDRAGGAVGFSLNVWDYDAMCLRCHRERDAETRADKRKLADLLAWVRAGA